MPEIRPLRVEDLERVAAVYEQAARSGSITPAPGLASAIGRLFLDAPYEGPDCPALVHEDVDRRIDAFMGVIVRRVRFGDELLRIGVSGPMEVAPDSRTKAVGVLFDRHLMTCGYDIVLTDGASLDARNVWTRLGGVSTPLGSMHWTRTFHPTTAALEELVQRLRIARGPIARVLRMLRPLAKGLDVLLRRWLGERLCPPTRAEHTEALGVDELLAGLDELGGRLRVRPDYDPETLTWLYRELRAVPSRGELRGQLVRGPKGRLLGWYLYYLKRDGRSQVLQLAARPGAMDAVVGHLFADADRGGSISLEGRAELELLEPLDGQRVRYRYGPPYSLIQTKRSDVLEALYSGRALLTRLEGEWWMGLHEEPYGEAAEAGKTL
jgi:hypothetical protein